MRIFGTIVFSQPAGAVTIRTAELARSGAVGRQTVSDDGLRIDTLVLQKLPIQQILDRAVVSTEIVDILAAAGITTPDISILSDEFLAEVQQLEKKTSRLRPCGSC